MNDLSVVSERVIEVIPAQWREDFFALIEGAEPSREFLEHMELNEKWQDLAEEAIRAMDSRSFVDVIRIAMKTSDQLPVR